MENYAKVVREAAASRSNSQLALSASTHLVLGHFVPRLIGTGVSDYGQFHRLSKSNALPKPLILTPILNALQPQIREALRRVITDRRLGPVLESFGSNVPKTPKALEIRLGTIRKGTIDAIKNNFIDALTQQKVDRAQSKMIGNAMAASGASFVLALAVARKMNAHKQE